VRQLIVILLLVSCNPTKPYKRVAADPNVTPKKKAIIAPFVSAHFPIKERITTDTIRVIDTVYDENTVLVLANIIDSMIMVKKDTVIVRDISTERRLSEQLRLAKKNCGRIITVRETIKDTIWQEDGATTLLLRDQIAKMDIRNNSLSYDVDVANKKAASASNRANILLLLLIISLLLLAFVVWVFINSKR